MTDALKTYKSLRTWHKKLLKSAEPDSPMTQYIQNTINALDQRIKILGK